MIISRRHRLLPTAAACAALATLIGSQADAASAAGAVSAHRRPHAVGAAHAGTAALHANAMAGPPGGDDGGDDPTSADQQYFQARSAPGIVAPGAYGAAFAQLQSMDDIG